MFGYSLNGYINSSILFFQHTKNTLAEEFTLLIPNNLHLVYDKRSKNQLLKQIILLTCLTGVLGFYL